MPVLFLVIRPISVVVGLAGAGVPMKQRVLMGWFGIRGIGSFPAGTGQTRGVIGLAALLVLFAAASAIITA